MNKALCPACKRDVVFDLSDGAHYCPACGARFELAPKEKPRRRPRLVHGLIFAVWMLMPAVVALLACLVIRQSSRMDLNQMLSKHATLAWIWFAVAAISSFACCAWLTGRFTDRTWAKLLVGLFLGAGILFCNLVVGFFGACAFFPLTF